MSRDGFDTGNIVVLTGAGISAESGIETFRDKGGVWERNRIEDVATPEAFDKDPPRVHEFYNARRRALGAANIQPNAAHKALALLEERLPSRVLIVTQNIDDLHERAGSCNLIHMHGELLKARCAECGEVRPQTDDLGTEAQCLHCDRKGAMRPHVVWFGEMPFEQDRIAEALDDCALFISIGTSGSVYPAAGFVHEVRMSGQAHTVELSLEPSSGESLFAERHYGPASRIVPHYVDRLLAGEAGFAPS
ncbi:MAG: NAD-dependent protein deacylase [Alphaproteobacteria bacterium]|jgi:NAD-dependent deacetylase|nr:NAD-dependent protein deacylase [Alphaproteobacteria bacterium]